LRRSSRSVDTAIRPRQVSSSMMSVTDASSHFRARDR
jgi:hypothetical protein